MATTLNEDKFYGVVNGVYYCGNDRVDELNDRISERNIPSEPLQAQFGLRPVSTKYAVMPILDQRAKSNVPIKQYTTYNNANTFNPGTRAPWSGFATNVNTESTLRNQFFALQKCEQSNYIPGSNSDMYNVLVTGRNVEQPFPDLFSTPEFETFNPNVCNTGNNFFDNFTRQQIKNISM